MAPEVASMLYALVSGLTWGAGDFSGGMASRRTPVVMVIMLSQGIGALCLLSAIIVSAEPLPQGGDLFFGACGGISGVIGLTAFYQGLAIYPMGAVAPVAAAISAMLPVLVSFVYDGLPAVTQTLGLGLAIAAIWTISRGGETASMQLRQLGLPTIGGVGFAGFFICMDQVSEGGVLWPVAAARCTATLLFACLIAGKRMWRTPPLRRLPAMLMAGVFDTAGNTFFALAANVGRLDIAAALASLYPATTVLLAWLVLREGLARQQWLGVATAVIAIMLMTW